MKVFAKVVIQRQIKESMVVKWYNFLFLYDLVKGFATVSIKRSLVVNYLLNL